VQDIVDGLVVAAQRLANDVSRLAPGTGEQDRTATSHKGIGRAQPLLQDLVFVLGQQMDINGFSQA
jgi:hypothetical protein